MGSAESVNLQPNGPNGRSDHGVAEKRQLAEHCHRLRPV
jgi:hypothetical protein